MYPPYLYIETNWNKISRKNQIHLFSLQGMFNMILDFCSSLVSKKSTFLVVINMSRFEMFLFLEKSYTGARQ